MSAEVALIKLFFAALKGKKQGCVQDGRAYDNSVLLEGFLREKTGILSRETT